MQMNHQQMHSGENGDVAGSDQPQTSEAAQKSGHEDDIQEMFIHQVLNFEIGSDIDLYSLLIFKYFSGNTYHRVCIRKRVSYCFLFAPVGSVSSPRPIG